MDVGREKEKRERERERDRVGQANNLPLDHVEANPMPLAGREGNLGLNRDFLLSLQREPTLIERGSPICGQLWRAAGQP